jgi:hypothetical protein
MVAFFALKKVFFGYLLDDGEYFFLFITNIARKSKVLLASVFTCEGRYRLLNCDGLRFYFWQLHLEAWALTSHMHQTGFLTLHHLFTWSEEPLCAFSEQFISALGYD